MIAIVSHLGTQAYCNKQRDFVDFMTANTFMQKPDPYHAINVTDGSVRGRTIAPKLKAPMLAVLTALSTAASGQTMTMEEMQAQLQAMQAKMQDMDAMRVKMQQMQKELDMLREKDAQRQTISQPLVASSGDRGREAHASKPAAVGEQGDPFRPTVAETEEVLEERMPLAGFGRHDPLVDPDFIKSVPLFGSDLRFSLGGYAKTDLIYDFDGNGDQYQFTLGDIPVNGSPPGGSYSKINIRESRTHLEVRNVASPYKNDKFYLEFDFWDGKDQTNFRLRHAYMQVGQLLAGRTWSIITELRALPLILDFAAGDAILGGRTEQIKWDGDKIFGAVDWAIGLESYNDTSILVPDSLEDSGQARSKAPRLSGGLSYPWDHGVVSVGGAINQVRFNGKDGLGNASELGWTTVIGSRVYLDPDNRHFLGFNAGYTHGTVQDIIAFANAGTHNAALTEDGELELAAGWNANMGLHLELPGKFSSNLHYAYTKLSDIPELFPADEMAVGWAAHANLMYDWDPHFRVGVEYMWGEREIVSGDDGDDARIQFSTFYFY